MSQHKKKTRDLRRYAARKILVEQLENRKLMAGDVMSSVMGASVVARNSFAVPYSYTLDLNSLPKGSAFGFAVANSGTVSGALKVVPAMDVSSFLRNSAMEEIVDSYTIDLNDLPEGSVFGLAVAGTETDSDDTTTGPAIDVSSLFGDSAMEEIVDSYTIDLNDLPEGSVFGLAVAGTETDSGDTTTGPAIDVSSLFGDSATEEVVDSYTIDLNDLPEGSVFGLAVAGTETDSGDTTTGPAIDVSSLFGDSATEEVVDSYTIDLNDLPEGSVFGLAVAGTETDSGDSTTGPAIDVSSLFGDSATEEVVDSYTIDLEDLPEGSVFGLAVAGTETDSGDTTTGPAIDVSSLFGDSATEEVVDSYTIDLNDLPEGSVFGLAVAGTETDSGDSTTGPAIDVSSLFGDSATEEVVDSYTIDLEDLPEGSVFGLAVAGTETDSGDSTTGPAIDVSSLFGDSATEEVVDSFTIDLNDLPEGSVFGLAAAGTETDSGDSTTGPTIDVSSLFGDSATEEVVDSFTIDLEDLPEGSVFGLAVAGTETDSGDSTTGPAIDVSSLFGDSATEEVVDSYTIDLEDLPEGSVFGLAVAGTETDSGDSTTGPAIDVSSLFGVSATEEVIDSFTIDLEDLPQGSVFGLAVAGTETDSGDTTVVPAIDISNLLGNSITDEIVDSFTIDLEDLPEGSDSGVAVASGDTLTKKDNKYVDAQGNQKSDSQGKSVSNKDIVLSSLVDLSLSQAGKRGRSLSMGRGQLVDAALNSLMFK